MRGIFAVDGGNATGLCWGVFDENARSVEDAFKHRDLDSSGSKTINHRVRRKGRTIVEDPLSDLEQVVEIYEDLIWFIDHCRCPVDLVVEDFILMPGAHAGGKDGVASVRIAWGLTGYILAAGPSDLDVNWQPPSAQGKYKDETLRRWGIWIPGREHERSALKHVCFRLNKLLK